VFQDVIPSDGERKPGSARTGHPFRTDELVKRNENDDFVKRSRSRLANPEE